MNSINDVSLCSTPLLEEVLDETAFSARIVTVDHYLNFPINGLDICYSDFRGCEVYKVPVIRIFGSTPAGQKTCLHVHGVYPYITVQYDNKLPWNESAPDFRRYTQELALNIDKALNIASRNGSSCKHHVYKISLTFGLPFYGYYKDKGPFLKIYFYNPNVLKRVLELLAGGAIMNKVIQPFEAHIPYILQFFIDYNLFGMNFINLGNFQFRLPSDNCHSGSLLRDCGNSSISIQNKIWDTKTIDRSRFCGRLKKLSTCELEVDCLADDILNRLQGQALLGRNPGLMTIWNEERKRQGLPDISQIATLASNERTNIILSESEILYKHRLKKIVTNHIEKSSSSGTPERIQIYSTPVLRSPTVSDKSFDSISFTDTQDKEMLSAFLSLANDHNGADQDSVLSLQTRPNPELDAEDAAETLEMSQCLSDVEDEDAENEFQNSHSGKNSDPNYCIPQLDGAGDEDSIQHAIICPNVPKLIIKKEPNSSPMLSKSPGKFDTQQPVSELNKISSPKEDTSCGGAAFSRLSRKRRHKSATLRSAAIPEDDESSEIKQCTSFQKYNYSLRTHQSFCQGYSLQDSRNTDIPDSKKDPSLTGMTSAEAMIHVDMTKIGCERVIVEKLSNAVIKKYLRPTLLDIEVDEKPEVAANKEPEIAVVKELEVAVSKEHEAVVSKESEVAVFKEPEDADINEPEVTIINEPEVTIINEPEVIIINEPEVTIIEDSEVTVVEDSMPKSPRLKMKFKLKRVNLRSNDTHVIVVDKELLEDEDINGKAIIEDETVEELTDQSKNHHHKRLGSATSKASTNVQYKNEPYKPPLLNEETLTKFAWNIPHNKRKLRSYSEKKESKEKHPSDVQRDNLSRLNLILTRNRNDEFDCVKSNSDKSHHSKRGHRRRRRSSKSNGLNSHYSVSNEEIVVQNLHFKLEPDNDFATQHEKLPKLHLKLNGNHRWTHCQSEFDVPTIKKEPVFLESSEDIPVSQKNPPIKPIRIILPRCSPTKKTIQSVTDSFKPAILHSKASVNDLQKLCRQVSIPLLRLPEDVVNRYTVNKGQKCNQSTILQEDSPRDLNSEMYADEPSQASHLNIMMHKDSPSHCSNDFEVFCSNQSPVPTRASFALSDMISAPQKLVTDNIDAMWKLSYFSPPGSTPMMYSSPPVCWSPNLELLDQQDSPNTSHQNIAHIKDEPPNYVSRPLPDKGFKAMHLPIKNSTNASHTCDIPSDPLRIEIKQEILSDSSNERVNNTFCCSSSEFLPSDNTSPAAVPQSNSSQFFHLPSSKEGSSPTFQWNSSLFCQNLQSQKSPLTQSSVKPTESYTSGSLLHRRLTETRHQSEPSNDIVLPFIKKEIEETNCCNLPAPKPLDIFSVLPSTQLSFYSTLDDDINFNQELTIKREKANSPDFLGSIKSHHLEHLPSSSGNYESISSSSECYTNDYSQIMKFPCANNVTNASTKPFSNGSISRIPNFQPSTMRSDDNLFTPFQDLNFDACSSNYFPDKSAPWQAIADESSIPLEAPVVFDSNPVNNSMIKSKPAEVTSHFDSYNNLSRPNGAVFNSDRFSPTGNFSNKFIPENVHPKATHCIPLNSQVFSSNHDNNLLIKESIPPCDLSKPLCSWENELISNDCTLSNDKKEEFNSENQKNVSDVLPCDTESWDFNMQSIEGSDSILVRDDELKSQKPLTNQLAQSGGDDILSNIVKSCLLDIEFDYYSQTKGLDESNGEMSSPNTSFVEFREPVDNFSSSDNTSLLDFIPPSQNPSQETVQKIANPPENDTGSSELNVVDPNHVNESRDSSSNLCDATMSTVVGAIHSFYGDETINEDISLIQQNPQWEDKLLLDMYEKPCTPLESVLEDITSPISEHLNESCHHRVNVSPSCLISEQYTQTVTNTIAQSKQKSFCAFQPKIIAPSRDEAIKSAHLHNIPEEVHQTPFYSEVSDIHKSNDLRCGKNAKRKCGIKEFETQFKSDIHAGLLSSSLINEIQMHSNFHVVFSSDKTIILKPNAYPPSVNDAKKWLENLTVNSEGKEENMKNPYSQDSQKSSESQKLSQVVGACGSPVVEMCNVHDLKTTKSRSPMFSTPINFSRKNRKGSKFKLNRQKGSQHIQEKDANPLYHDCPLSPLVPDETMSMKRRKLCYDGKSKGFRDINAAKTPDVAVLQQNLQLQGNNSLDSTSSQIEGPSLENTGGFKVNLGSADSPIDYEPQHLTLMSLEIHINTREDLRPDPEHDPISAIFFCISSDSESGQKIGIIAVYSAEECEESNLTKLTQILQSAQGVAQNLVFCVRNEMQMFEQLSNLVQIYDPDILLGYDIQKLSIGYIVNRGLVLNIDMNSMLSRLLDKSWTKDSTKFDDPKTDDSSDQQIVGRIVLNVWRLMRKEVTLNIYSFENVLYHVLHVRTPSYSFQNLTSWYKDRRQPLRWKVLQYYILRVSNNIKLLESLNIIQKTSELARVFGIQFYEVLSRGSQFRVESMMLRMAKPLGYIPVSPSVKQRSLSRAPECVPLILEPKSNFYVDPVIVLDFQSLYPSMIIAYNYCFSTCLGRVDNFEKSMPFEFGCTSLPVSLDLLQKLGDDVHIAPTGVAFVKSSVRQGILPIMLEDILNTRILVKQSLKMFKSNRYLSRLLDARQLGLKLIANVTYGYTSANFSGRMPCVEIADSIVAKGRETLETAIHMIESSSEWRAKVIYGDTDSVFVLLPGRSKEQAFQIGQEMADAVTAVNPKPVKLKFEKVYLPCVLQTKKRYVGYMYESPDQKEPVFDAKGIETVRRDSCAAVAKMLEKSLKILFDSRDVSLVKKYVQKQFGKLLSGKASMIDCIFAKEYRGRAGYRPGACVPALEISKKRLLKDPQSEPNVGERVPYVVVYGCPGLPVIQLVKEPGELLDDSSLRINAKYYITRVISPPLDRVFSLIGADVQEWYTNICHTHVPSLPMVPIASKSKGTLSQYFTALSCPSCERATNFGLCGSCQKDAQTTAVILNNKIRNWERCYYQLTEICRSCTKSSTCTNSCISLDCPVQFRLNKANRDFLQVPYLRNILVHELF